jgi:outer membrane protein assembly factor BamB
VSIVVQCPHCETRFNLQAELNGKSMRCPNMECRQVFTVQALEATAPPELPPEPPPPPKTTKPAKTASKPVEAKAAKPAGKASRQPVEAKVVDAVVVEASVVAPPKVKEVEWSEGTDVPPPPGSAAKKGRKPLKPEVVEEAGGRGSRRDKKGSLRPLFIALMLVSIVGALLAAGGYIWYYQQKQEEKLAKSAEEEYSKANYGEAAKHYLKLGKEYPSSKNVEKYKFFAELSSMQTIVRAVANRDNYDAGVKRLQTFIESVKDDPLAKPTSGYGRDILEAGKKLGEDIAGFAEDRVKKFVDDRAKNAGELKRAEEAITVGRSLVPLLDPFRGPDDPPLDKLRTSYDAVEQSIKRERDRTAAIERARADLVEPTDAKIQHVESDLAAANLASDAEAQKLIADAKGRLRDLVKYEDDAAGPQPPPPTAAASLLFVTPLGKTRAREPVPGEPATVFLCVARGILYALDEDTGALLWATRVGPDVTDPPAVARADLAAGPTDLAVVTSNVGGPAVAGHVLRTGRAVWYQPLPSPAAGPAVVVGTRAFVPVRDALGSVYEFDLTTGARVGRIRIGQPVAERGAVLRPGTGLLYVAADARRLYVIDAGGKDDDGNRVNPRCAQVIATGHLPGTLRVPPLFIGPEGVDPAERWMILTQAEGTAHTLLRAFNVGAIAPSPTDGTTVPETPAVPVITVTVPGWVSFPPACDGERLAVCSDIGALRLFGVNQPGNSDKALFPYPTPPNPPALDKPIPGLVIPVEEATYWIIAAGQLQKARLAVAPNRGQEIVFAGAPVTVGEPIHAAQLNARRDTGCLVVRSLNSSGCRAVAFDLSTGEIRWQRQLGLVPAKVSSAEHFAAPIVQGDHFVLVDEEGGIVAVPAASGATGGETLSAPAPWVLASAPLSASGPTVVVASPDGKTVFTITPINRDGPRFLVRRVADGKLVQEDETVAPAGLAGQPAVVGDDLLIPTADGFVNRFVPGDGRVRPGTLVAGPSWLGERKPGSASCSITPLSNASFATSDGGKKLNRWDWPAGGKWSPSGSWDLRDMGAGPGVVVPSADPGGTPRLIIADASGSVWLFAADKGGLPLRRWHAGAHALPPGKPSSGFAAQASSPGRTTAVYAVDGKSAAAVDPEKEDAIWSARTGEDATSTLVGAPQPAGANRWVITDLAGRVLVLDGTTGAELARQTVGLPGAVPAAPSAVIANTVLTPLSDGSAVVIELPAK